MSKAARILPRQPYKKGQTVVVTPERYVYAAQNLWVLEEKAWDFLMDPCREESQSVRR